MFSEFKNTMKKKKKNKQTGNISLVYYMVLIFTFLLCNILYGSCLLFWKRKISM